MGKLFLYGRSAEKHITTPFSKLTVYCQPGIVVQAISADETIVYHIVSNTFGEAVFDRLTEGDWDIVLPDIANAIPYRIRINSLDYEIMLAYFEATINVVYPEGSTCTISDGEHEMHAPDTSGVWTCIVSNPGSYTVTSVSSDSMSSDSETVQVVSDGDHVDVLLSYFTATINVTYPEGAVCVATDGNRTLEAPDTTGIWNCVVPNAGNWTISATSDGVRSDSDSVTITENGQNVAVSLKFFEAYINVIYPLGSTCTISTNGVTTTAPDISGTWNAHIWNPGEVTVSSTNGIETESETVVISSDGQTVNVTLRYFEAYISVTYPAGSTCTCSDGIITLTADNTSGTYTFIVPNTGTWTVRCANGDNSDSEIVSITERAQEVSVSLDYWDGTLFYKGNQYEEITGGWSINGDGTTDPDLLVIGDTIDLEPGSGWLIVLTNKRVPFDKYTKLYATIDYRYNLYVSSVSVGVDSVNLDDESFDASVSIPAGTYGEYTCTVDISAMGSSGYVGMFTETAPISIIKVWLE